MWASLFLGLLIACLIGWAATYLLQVRRIRALERSKGNRTKAAELLDLSVRALSYKIQDYDLE